MTTTTEQPTTGAAIEALAGRLFESAVGALELCNIHLGDRLGLYGQLAQSGPLTAAALADRLGLDRPRAEPALVEERLERPADEQRRKVEPRRLVVRVDDRAQGGGDASRGAARDGRRCRLARGSPGRRTSDRLRLRWRSSFGSSATATPSPTEPGTTPTGG